MSFIDNVLKRFFGDKSQRDIKEIMPVVELVKKEYERITGCTNDELRAETEKLKARIKEYIKAEEDEIAELKEKVESDIVPLEENEKIYNRIDKLEEAINIRIEEVLNEILPTAFAVVKETAKCFFENEKIEVSATEFDRNLAAANDYVEIKGEKAIYDNHWQAGGAEQVWNMIHYDVQLVGGIVLHSGKVAEMALPAKGFMLLLLTTISQNVTRSGWDLFLSSTDCRLIVLISTNLTRKSVGLLIMLISHMVRITNLVSTTSEITWLSIHQIWFSVNIITLLWMR
jgi:gas vesicle protein